MRGDAEARRGECPATPSRRESTESAGENKEKVGVDFAGSRVGVGVSTERRCVRSHAGRDAGPRPRRAAASDWRSRMRTGVHRVPGRRARTHAGSPRDLARSARWSRERGAIASWSGCRSSSTGTRGTGAGAARAVRAGARRGDRAARRAGGRALTTVEAERALREAPRQTRASGKQVIDAMAATLLLRTYLDAASGGRE